MEKLTHKLMIKTHNTTGLKYLCYTRSANYVAYKGSGKYWKRYLKKYGYDISTELIYESQNFEEFKKIAISKSLEYNIIESEDWANLKIEEGDGGNTVSNKIWITDGIVDKFLDKTLTIPEGWNRGRSKCVFNNKENQSVFGKSADLKKRGDAIRKAWASGKINRDHSKCGVRGELNPAKRKEVRDKISDSQKHPITVNGIDFQSIGDAVIRFGVCHRTIHKWIANGHTST